VFFKSVNNSQSYHKSLAQLCHQELVEKMQLFLNVYVSHGSTTRFLTDGEKYCIFVDNLLLFPTVKEFSKSVNN